MGKIQKRRQRLQVPLDQDVFDALEDYANFSGRSKASIAEDLISEAVPALFQLTKAIQTLELDATAGIKEIADLAYRASQEARQLSIELTEEVDKRA